MICMDIFIRITILVHDVTLRGFGSNCEVDIEVNGEIEKLLVN